MTQACNQCSRANPSEAAYCYFDGVRLAGAGSGGPVNAATAPFPNQFVFPTGQACRNFDQLALACQQNWQSAVEMLKSGLLSNFFGGLGRADLALAAQEAARFPDQDRGLDQLLIKLPSQALQAPKIKVEPSDINVGQISIGTDRTLEVHLANQGMRLLYGTVASDQKWLTLGEGPGSSQKLFQFGAETTIPIHIRGNYLRAGTKPLEGQLLIESNAGNVTVTVRATVPITPFKEGVLAGSQTPRQIAEKAKANPAAAAPLFENGAVGKWFESNGWIYPVQGPSANGIGAVQQFFEALGLAKAPKVEINTQALVLKGIPGQSLQTTLQVTTQEKKPVYAHASCDQAWVDVSKVKLAGRQATITIAVASVPSRPGEALKANIHVQGNGNQRFTVPLTLTVLGTPGSAPEGDASPFAALDAVTPASPPARGSRAPVESIQAAGVSSSPSSPAAPLPDAAVDIAIKKVRQHFAAWVHLAPLVVLFVALVALFFRDYFGTSIGSSGLQEAEIDPNPKIKIFYDYQQDDKDKPAKKSDIKKIHYNMNFGILKIEPSNELVKLTYGEQGRTNNTLLHFNGTVSTFGKSPGRWHVKPKFTGDDSDATWELDDVHFSQTVRVLPGEPVEEAGFKRFKEVCLVKYKIENKSPRSHSIGMRILLDTYIGMNDDVPFTIPGMKDLMATSKEFKDGDVPDFIMALENPSLDKPGTVVQLNLRPSAKFEPPSMVKLTAWPGDAKLSIGKMDVWDIPLNNIATDSSVVMYWLPQRLEPNETRELGYTYGLGSLSSKGGQIALTVGGSFTVGGELSVMALVNNAKDNETVTLKLPPELIVVQGTATQPVPAAHKDSGGKLRPAPVTWRVRADKEGTVALSVVTSSGATQIKRVVIRKTSIF